MVASGYSKPFSLTKAGVLAGVEGSIGATGCKGETGGV